MDRESKEPYLVRYYLFLKDRKKFPFNLFIHNFLRSDPGDLHDHPFGYFTIILKGGYWEWIPKKNSYHTDDNRIIGEERVWRGPGHFRLSKATSYHRIDVEPGTDCWTLFMPGPQKREWGFLTHTEWNFDTFEWIRHDKYIVNKKII